MTYREKNEIEIKLMESILERETHTDEYTYVGVAGRLKAHISFREEYDKDDYWNHEVM